MTEKDLKELRKVIFETNMISQGKKKIKYLDMEDLMEIVEKGEIGTLNQETYDYYREEILLQMRKQEDMRLEEEKRKMNEWTLQVEEDKKKVIETAVSMDKKLPWQLRRNPETIKKEVNQIVGQPFPMSLDYRKKLEEYLGVEGGEINERISHERVIQSEFDKRQKGDFERE